jgi:hypothetical protein
MTFQGRSLDDMPLTAYSTGVVPTDDEPDPVPDAGYTSVPAPASSTADLVAHAHAEAAEAAEAAAPARSGRRFSLPFRLPGLRRGNQAALEAAAPFHAVAPTAASLHAVAPSAASFHAVTMPANLPPRPFEPVHAPEPAHAPKAVPDAGMAPPRRRPLPQLQWRDPRVLAGGAIGVGLLLLAISLLGGGGLTPGTGPGSSQDAGGVLPTSAPGNASVELTSGLATTITLTGATGAGPAVDSQLNATWTDPVGNSLGIVGTASQGTRTTDANFMLTWTMYINGSAVTFTSKASECTIGMAVGPKAVHGTFVCKKLTSGDGSHMVDFRGTYTT